MERNVKIVCRVVRLLWFLCASTGFAAEFTRTKSVQPSGTICSFPGSPAFGLGITALVCLLLAQTILTIATRCGSYKGTHTSRPRLCRIFHLFFYNVSCMFFGFASVGLPEGAYFNRRFVYTLRGTDFIHSIVRGADFNHCPVPTQFYFAAVTIVGLLGLEMHLSFYTDVSAESENLLPTRQGDVAVGQPQFPPREGAQDPVTVHKDTHAKGHVLQV